MRKKCPAAPPLSASSPNTRSGLYVYLVPDISGDSSILTDPGRQMRVTLAQSWVSRGDRNLFPSIISHKMKVRGLYLIELLSTLQSRSDKWL